MSESDHAAPLLCRNPDCGRPFGGPVRFCPFCGTAQHVVPERAPEHDRRHDDAPPVVAATVAPPDPPPPEPAPHHVPPPGRPATRLDFRRAATALGLLRSPWPRRHRWLLLGAYAFLIFIGCAWLYWMHPPSAYGRIMVTAAGPASGVVTLDGADAGRPAHPFTAAVGDHLVGLRTRHWSAGPVRVVVSAGQLVRVTLSPRPDRATLQVQTLPANAALLLNGRMVGPSPVSLSLAPGTWRLRAEIEGFRQAVQTVVLAPGEQRVLSLRLDPLQETHARILAQPGIWSPPVPLAPGETFSLVFQGRVRVRFGNQVVLLDGGSANLGTIEARSLQVKSAGPGRVPVEVVMRHVATP